MAGARAFMRPMPVTLITVALGGAFGAVLRYLSVSAALRLFGPGFPWGTLFVNVAGSLVMGVAAALILEKAGAGRISVFLMTGVLGGFTTFSAFSLDALYLIERGKFAASAVYIGGSVVLSVLALILGLWAGRALA
jgi:CrcB protein